MGGSHRSDTLDVQARLDLQLDPLIALAQVRLNALEQLGRVVGDTDRDAARHAILVGPQMLSEGTPLGAQLRIEERVDHGGLGHGIAANTSEDTIQVVGGHVPRREERRRQEVADRQPRALVPLFGVAGIEPGHALPPPFCVFGDDPREHTHLLGLDAEAGAERALERKADQAQLELGDLGHGSAVKT